MINLSALPAPSVIETLDFEAVYAAHVAEFLDRWAERRAADADLPAIDTLDLETDPLAIAFQVSAYREILLRARINDAAVRANLIALAVGSDLDHQAAFYNVVRLEGETDAALRSRVVLAVQGRSAGGTEERYAFVARTASARVRDVAVYRLDGGPVIRVAIRSTDNGGVPDQALLDTVRNAISAPDVALVSDVIEVIAGVSDIVDIEANIWLLPDAPLAIFEGLPNVLRSAWEAEAGMGFDLNPSWIKARLHVAGVALVDVAAPIAPIVVDDNNAIALGDVTLTLAGRSR